MKKPQPSAQRKFAVDVVRALREQGFEAYWAGGCVRDQLLRIEPKDYDVATSATPEQVRYVFRKRKTLSVGEAFGVIIVLGPRGAGQIEVATFREEEAYSDGRHPDRVTYSNARADASRRDFTINGLFYDPVDQQVIDFVDGQTDLRAKLVRAIGDPAERFEEDKLRLLRAVRFATTFDFALEEKTFDVIRQKASQIGIVSAERIAAELERMLTGPGRARAVRLLLETGLARTVLPEIVEDDPPCREKTLARLDYLERPNLAVALAALLFDYADPSTVEAVCRRLKMPNRTTDRAVWLIQNRDALHAAPKQPWSVLQPVLVAAGIEDLLTLLDAQSRTEGNRLSDDLAFCRECLKRPVEELDPEPFLTGNDLKQLGVRPGPQYKKILDQVRAAQLDQEITTRAEVFAMVEKLLADFT